MSKWISVKDRLPEDFQEVVVYYPPNDYDAGCKEVVTYFPVEYGRGGWCEAEHPNIITLWLPIPEIKEAKDE